MNTNNKKDKNRNKNNIDLTKDLVFKSYFKGSDKILISLLNGFLPLEKNHYIQSVEVLDPALSSDKHKKSPVLDLRVRLNNNTSVNIEMQSISKQNFKERILFYLAKLYTWNLKSGEDYKKIYPAYSLVFTKFVVFKEIKEYCSFFQFRSETNPQVVFSKYLGIVLVELDKFKKKDLKSFDSKDVWCYLIKNSKEMTKRELSQISERGTDMKEAVVRIKKLSKEESDLMIEEAIEKNRRDRVAELDYAREEGFTQGREKGIEKGMKEGMELAALNMLKNKMSLSLISKITGLSQSGILKLRKQLK